MKRLRVEPWMHDELQRRKELYRRLWAGQPLDRLPVEVRVSIPSPYTIQEQFRDGEKQLSAALANALATWEHAPSSDTIPAMRPDVGCSCLASAFGAEYFWSDNPNQTPGVQKKILTLDGRTDQSATLPSPDPQCDGWLPEGLARIHRFAEAGEGFIPVSLLDAAGGVNVAADLLGMTELMIAFYDQPEAVHALLGKIQDLYAATIRAGIQAAGGEQNITTTDFEDLWYPEGWKGHVSDDISAGFGPDIYAEFSAPYHARIFREFGAGGLHNCGPNPCHAAYVAHTLSPRSLDLTDAYSHDDLPKFKQSLRGKAFIYLFYTGRGKPVEWYREIMELMAPDVIVVPVFHVSPQDQPETLGRNLRVVATEYAKRMDWGWGSVKSESRTVTTKEPIMNRAAQIFTTVALVLVSQTLSAADLTVVAQGNGQTTYRKADLPPLMEFADGTPVRSMEDWARRKDEIRRLIIETFVGTYPEKVPVILKAEVLQEQRKEDGSLRRQVRLTFDTKNKASFEMWIWVPKGEGPFPVLLTAPRYYQLGWAEMALQRGYIVGLYPGLDHSSHEPAYPDYENVWNRFRTEYPEATWTEISTKAWLASRALDYLLDPKYGYLPAKGQVAIIGWSRYGKQSLIAAAFDERITCVVARSAGSPASSPYRFSSYLEGGETPIGFPDAWFLQSMRLYNGRENEMPIDAHGWLALIAPRRCLLHTAYNDDASDVTFAVEREYLEGKKVYQFLGQGQNLCLDYRPGGHGPLTDEQRRRNLDWMDFSFGRGAVGANAFPEPKLIHRFDWPAWKAKQNEEDLRFLKQPVAVGNLDEMRSRIVWMLGRAPARIAPSTEEPFLTRAQEIERFGEDRDPDRYASPDTTRIAVFFGNGVRGNLYFSTKRQERPLPVVIWLHPYSWAIGYCSGYEAVIPWGQSPARTPYHHIAGQGYAVLAFDQVGFGSRLLEGRDFYEQYPHWSKLGRMVHDVRSAVDFLIEGKGQAQRELPNIDKKQVYLLGYALGGMVGLYATALDQRIAGVACFSGFTPLRTDTDAKPTGGIRRLWEWYGLIPKLGLYHGRETDIPYDYDDVLQLIAPRACLIVAQKRDRHATFFEVAACMDRAGKAWKTTNGSQALTFLTPDDITHFQNAEHDLFLKWVTGVSSKTQPSH